jgi:hypothetical protein
LALQKYAIQQLLSSGKGGRVDWTLLPIIALYYHMMHTGDLTMARTLFDYMVKELSNIDSIAIGSGKVLIL